MKSLFFFVFLCLTCVVSAQKLETFHLKNGETIIGEVLEDDNGILIVRTNGETRTVFKDEILPPGTNLDSIQMLAANPSNNLANTNTAKRCLQVGGTLGYSTQGLLTLDMHFASQSGWGAVIDLGFNVVNKTKGEIIYNIEFSDNQKDKVSEGRFYNVYNVGLSKYFSRFYFTGLIGFAQKWDYQNRYDETQMLGNNGNYFIQKSNGGAFNYGGEVGFLTKSIMISTCFTRYSGFGIKLGVYL